MTRRVLILDDERTIVVAIARFCSPLGWATVGAHSLEQAKAALAASAFDAAIVDLNLGDGTRLGGLEFIRHARAVAPTVRCVVCTAHESLRYRAEAAAAGACGYLIKPVPLADLVEHIEIACDEAT